MVWPTLGSRKAKEQNRTEVGYKPEVKEREGVTGVESGK